MQPMSLWIRVQLVRKVDSEYHNLEGYFLQDITKFHVICKHIGQFVGENVYKKIVPIWHFLFGT